MTLPVKLPARRKFDQCATLDELYAVFVDTRSRVEQITNRPCEMENNLNSTVLEYIEKNFCQNDICLSKISEELSLSANLISRIVKESSRAISRNTSRTSAFSAARNFWRKAR